MIAIGFDHAGVAFKNEIVAHLKKRKIEIVEFGPPDGAVASDYPDYAEKVCREVIKGKATYGILICGTGIGMSIAANKFDGIRCALCGDSFSAKATREHNNANVLALGNRVLGVGLALDIVDAFLDTPFSREERHIKRIEKIAKYEKGGK